MKIQTSTRVCHGQGGEKYALSAGTHTVPDAVGDYLVRRGYAVAIAEESVVAAAVVEPKAPVAETAEAAAEPVAEVVEAAETVSEETEVAEPAQSETAAAETAPAGGRRGRAKG